MQARRRRFFSDLLFVMAGIVAWLVYGVVMYIRHWRPPTVEELISGAVVIGFVLLFVSVAVERLRQLPHDRYRRIDK